MQQAAFEALFSYWDGLRGTAPAPQRRDIKPAALRDILPNVFLLERDAEGRFVYRLAGTDLCQMTRRELRGQRPLSQFCDLDRRKMQLALAQVSEAGRVFVCESLARTPKGRSIVMHWLVLPLAHTPIARQAAASATSFSRLIGVCVPEDRPSWLGRDAILRQSILAACMTTPAKGAELIANLDVALAAPLADRKITHDGPRNLIILRDRLERQFGRRTPNYAAKRLAQNAVKNQNFNVVPLAPRNRRVQHLTVFDGGRDG